MSTILSKWQSLIKLVPTPKNVELCVNFISEYTPYKLRPVTSTKRIYKDCYLLHKNEDNFHYVTPTGLVYDKGIYKGDIMMINQIPNCFKYFA